MNILLIVTGSISAYKAPSIANGLRKAGNEVKVVLTDSSQKFITKLSFSSQGLKTYTDKDDWDYEGVLHIELKDWSDYILVAPCSANTLAKVSNGYADNLATNILRAKSYNKVFSLAMNTDMYTNTITYEQAKKIKYRDNRNHFIKPDTKLLACGVEGIGALPSTKRIIEFMKELV